MSIDCVFITVIGKSATDFCAGFGSLMFFVVKMRRIAHIMADYQPKWSLYTQLGVGKKTTTQKA